MILTCGEAVADIFLAPAADAPSDPSSAPVVSGGVLGGSPYSLARGLARLGAPAAFLGGLSTDALGQRFAARLSAEGVSLAYAPRTPKPTAAAFIDVGPDGAPVYHFSNPDAADLAVTAADLPRDLNVFDSIHLASYPLIVGDSAEAFEILGRRAAEADVPLALDVNVRPAVITDMEIWRTRIAAHAARSAVVKLSDEDLALLNPGAAPADIAARLLANGAALVVLTQGPGGASAWTAAAHANVPAPKIEVIDTVGAGDAFQAALVAALHRLNALAPSAAAGLDANALHALLTEAAAAGAIACSRRGADPATAAELRAFLGRKLAGESNA